MEEDVKEIREALLQEANELTREDRPYKKEDLERLKEIYRELSNLPQKGISLG